MPKASWSLCLILAAGLLPVVPASLLPAAHAQTRPATRPLAAVLVSQSSPLNTLLLQTLRKELPKFEPVMIGTPFTGEPAALVADLKRGGTQLGGQAFTTGELAQLRQAQLVLIPRWSYGPLALTGPHAPAAEGEFWSFGADSELSLALEVWRPGQDAPLTTLNESFKVRENIPIRDLDQLLRLVKDVSGVPVDVTNPLHQALVLDVVRKIPTFQQLQEQEPATTLAEESVPAVAGAGFAALAAAIREQKGFALADGVEAFENNRMRVNVEALKGGSTAMDAGYKIISADGGEIGYARVRGRSGDSVELEPLTVSRDPVPGDTLVPYPKLGLNVVLGGGTASLWLNDPQMAQFGPTPDFFFRPATQLEFQYDLAPFINFPETYVLLNGGGTFALPAFPGTAQATGIHGELGLLKRWTIRQWSIDAGLSGGLMLGLFTYPPGAGFDTPTTLGFGGTARVGVNYSFTPEFMLGLAAGFRYYGFGPWMGNPPGQFPQPGFPPQPLFQLPQLMSIGPVLQLQASYLF